MDNFDQSKVFLSKCTFLLNMNGCLRTSTDNVDSAILSWSYLNEYFAGFTVFSI